MEKVVAGGQIWGVGRPILSLDWPDFGMSNTPNCTRILGTCPTEAWHQTPGPKRPCLHCWCAIAHHPALQHECQFCFQRRRIACIQVAWFHLACPMNPCMSGKTSWVNNRMYSALLYGLVRITYGPKTSPPPVKLQYSRTILGFNYPRWHWGPWSLAQIEPAQWTTAQVLRPPLHPTEQCFSWAGENSKFSSKLWRKQLITCWRRVHRG